MTLELLPAILGAVFWLVVKVDWSSENRLAVDVLIYINARRDAREKSSKGAGGASEARARVPAPPVVGHARGMAPSPPPSHAISPRAYRTACVKLDCIKNKFLFHTSFL